MIKDQKPMTKADFDKEIKRLENLVKQAPKNLVAKESLDELKALRKESWGDK